VHALLYPLPIVTQGKRVSHGFAVGLLTLLIIAIGLLPVACGDETELAEGVLCFTPDNAAVGVAQSIGLVATITPSGVRGDRHLNEESGWRWLWSSDDGGEIEFTQVELQWSGASEGIYVAGVGCRAVKAGSVTVSIGQPNDQFPLLLVGNEICEPACTITIGTAPPMW